MRFPRAWANCSWCGARGTKDVDIKMTCVGVGAHVDLCADCRRKVDDAQTDA